MRVDFDALGRIDDAVLVIEDGRFSYVGSRRGERSRGIDLSDCVVFPGFVDAHSHPLFSGDREPDFAARLAGEPPPLGMLVYGRAHARGVARSAEILLRTIARPRLATILAHGTTTLETKTGYALHKPGETALLDLIARHRDDSGIPRLIPTFLGAHALPPEFTREEAFVDYLIDQVVPAAASHGAVYADAFCEPGFFSPAQTRRYLDAARLHGMRLRVHCDEMAYGGAAEMAASLDVDAVDHCNYIRKYDVGAIAQRGIVTVACPATIAYLDLPQRAPVRALLEPAEASRSQATTIPEPRRVSIYRRSRILAADSSASRPPRRCTASPAPRRIPCAPMPVGFGSGPRPTLSRCGWNRPPSSAGSSAEIWPRSSSRTASCKAPAERRHEQRTRPLRASARFGKLRNDYAFVVRDGTITDAGDVRDVRARVRHLASRSFPPDRLVVPGFFNGHSHAYQILLRGWADDWPFSKWRSDALYRVVPQLTPRRRLLDLRCRILRDARGRHYDRCRVLLSQWRRKRARRGCDPRRAGDGNPPGPCAHVDGRTVRAARVSRGDRRRRGTYRRTDGSLSRCQRLRRAALAARGVARDDSRRRRVFARARLHAARPRRRGAVRRRAEPRPVRPNANRPSGRSARSTSAPWPSTPSIWTTTNARCSLEPARA